MASRPSRAQYARVDEGATDTGPGADSQTATSRAERRKRRSAQAEEYAVKLHAALWVAAAGAAAWYTDIFSVCLSSDQVSRFWFNIGLCFFSLASVLVLYMAVWVPRVNKCDLDPSVYSPRMLPFTAGCSVASGLFLVVGLWPVYGLFTPGLLTLLWFGSLMSAHFLPSV